MHITYILLHFPYLTETFVAEEIRSLRERGEDVAIISLLEPGKGAIQRDSQALLPHCWYAPSLISPKLWLAQVYYLTFAFPHYVALLWRLLRQPYPSRPLQLFTKRLVIFLKAVATAHELRTRQIDLLHTHFAWLAGAATWVCAELLNVPYTVTTHAFDIYATEDLLDVTSANAAQVFTISEYNRNNILARGCCDAEDIQVIHCGVDADRYRGLDAIGKPSREDSVLEIVAVGSLNEKKGHEYLIQACDLIRKQGERFHCNIIGGGGREGALRQLIQQLDLNDYVTIHGALSHETILKAYGNADIFALACVVAADGDRDGIPVSIMEAGIAGLAIVSTTVSGIPELVRHEETGLLVPERNAPALADAILRLSQNPELRQELGLKARQLVLSDFSAEGLANQLIEAMHAVVTRSNSHSLHKADMAERPAGHQV